MRTQVSTIVHAPPDRVRQVYADYTGWPAMFPTISGVRLLRRHGNTQVLEVDHVEGRVLNELAIDSAGQLVLREAKRHYDALFVNRFDAVPEGTRFTDTGTLWFKGYARAVEPFLGWYVRRQMRRLQVQPVKRKAESSQEDPYLLQGG